MSTLTQNKCMQSLDITTTQSRQAALKGIQIKYWINVDGTDFLYKIDDAYQYGFGELFYSYICNKLAVNCVNVYPAYDKKEETKGVIVESFVSNKKTNVSLRDFLQDNLEHRYLDDDWFYSYDDFVAQLARKQKKEGFILEKGFLDSIKKMIFIDFLLGNEDRHLNNIEVYVEKNMFGRTRVSLAPLFDNGMSLGLRNCSRRRRFDVDELSYVSLPRFAFYKTEEKMRYADPVEEFAYSQAKQLKNDPVLQQLYEDIKNINIRQELEYVSKVSGYNLSENQMEYITKFLEYRLYLMEHILEKDFSQPVQEFDGQNGGNKLSDDEYFEYYGVSRD